MFTMGIELEKIFKIMYIKTSKRIEWHWENLQDCPYAKLYQVKRAFHGENVQDCLFRVLCNLKNIPHTCRAEANQNE